MNFERIIPIVPMSFNDASNPRNRARRAGQHGRGSPETTISNGINAAETARWLKFASDEGDADSEWRYGCMATVCEKASGFG
jgi:hypothetical protein